MSAHNIREPSTPFFPFVFKLSQKITHFKFNFHFYCSFQFWSSSRNTQTPTKYYKFVLKWLQNQSYQYLVWLRGSWRCLSFQASQPPGRNQIQVAILNIRITNLQTVFIIRVRHSTGSSWSTRWRKESLWSEVALLLVSNPWWTIWWGRTASHRHLKRRSTPCRLWR